MAKTPTIASTFQRIPMSENFNIFGYSSYGVVSPFTLLSAGAVRILAGRWTVVRGLTSASVNLGRNGQRQQEQQSGSYFSHKRKSFWHREQHEVFKMGFTIRIHVRVRNVFPIRQDFLMYDCNLLRLYIVYRAEQLNNH